MKWTCIAASILAAAMLSGCTQRAGDSPPSGAVTTLDSGSDGQSNSVDNISVSEEERNSFQQKCMKEAGFTYVPFVPKFDTENDGLPDSAEEAVAMWGFGISTNIEGRFSAKGVPAKLVEEDPNMAIIEGFSSQEQAAYQQAMFECFGRADKKLGPRPGVGDDSVEANRKMEETQREIEKDSRMIKARQAWATCMSAQGYRSANQNQLISDITEKAEPFIEKYSAAVLAEWDKQREAGNQSWVGDDLRVVDVLSPGELAELTDLQGYEMGAAAANLVCSKKLNGVMTQVSKEMGDDNKAQ